jgi:hypothetical protein
VPDQRTSARGAGKSDSSQKISKPVNFVCAKVIIRLMPDQ